MILNRIEYQRARKARGTQTQIADALGISRVTIMRRETARSTVTREAMLALLTLPVIAVTKCQKKQNPKSASPIAADSATAPAPRKSKDAGNGSAAGVMISSKGRSTSVAQLRITRGKGGAITSTASVD
jgi:DNA-binding XRE family transcriptional regulator